jgi:hypothetical protein
VADLLDQIGRDLLTTTHSRLRDVAVELKLTTLTARLDHGGRTFTITVENEVSVDKPGLHSNVKELEL